MVFGQILDSTSYDQVCKYSSMQVCKYANMQVYTCLMNKETDVTYLRFPGLFQHKLTAHWRKKESPS